MRLIIVADTAKQRLALSDVLDKLGFGGALDASLDVEQVLSDSTLTLGAVWLIDVANYSTELQDKVNEFSPEQVILGFEPVPSVYEENKYERWQRGVLRRLSDILGVERPFNLKLSPEAWEIVVVLGASMGGPDAVKAFLDELSPELPVAVLLAQHYDETMLESLPKILTRHNKWRCKIVKSSQSLQSGLCLIAPVDKQIMCDSTGRVILTKNVWSGRYRPNIGALLKNASDVFGNQMIGIVLSGMGDDGSQYAKQLPVNQSRLWAQDPATCLSPSQPQAFIDTNVCQFVGSPTELADKVTKLLGGFGRRIA